MTGGPGGDEGPESRAGRKGVHSGYKEVKGRHAPEGSGRGRAGARDSRQGIQALHGPIGEIHEGIGLPLAVQLQFGKDHALRVQPQVHGPGLVEAPNEEAGSNKQNHRQSGLQDQESGLPSGPASRCSSSAVLQ